LSYPGAFVKKVLNHLPALLAAITLSTWVAPAAAQEFRVTAISLDPENRPRLEFPSNTNSYYVLYRGYEVTNITTPIALVLGADANGALVDAGSPTNSTLPRFYRLREIPIAQPADTDGDLIDDLYELDRPSILNPLVTADGGEDPDNDDLTNAEEYFASTNPALADSDGDGWVDGIELNDETEPLSPLSRPRHSLPSRPPVLVDLPSPEGAGTSGIAVLVARPPVATQISSPDASGATGVGIVLAKPGVLVNVPSPDASGTSGSGVFLARPPLLAEIPSSDGFGTAGSAAFLALPATTVAIESTDAAGAGGHTLLLAQPPVNIRINSQ
jgi:hypothetical protein